jgi:hypothetical protein
MSDLTRAIAEAIHCEKVDEPKSEPDPYCMEHGEPWPCPEPERIAAALAPLIEARVRKARADEVRLLIRQLEGGDGDEFDTYLAESLKKPLVLQGFLGGRLAFLSAERVRDA